MFQRGAGCRGGGRGFRGGRGAAVARAASCCRSFCFPWVGHNGLSSGMLPVVSLSLSLNRAGRDRGLSLLYTLTTGLYSGDFITHTETYTYVLHTVSHQ